jgi:mRNA-degrading endonuclease toxin of MazEF toxin-antitoxin module
MARGDVLMVSLPATSGREQSGRRPAVAVQTDIAGEPMLMIAPITSNLTALRFTFSVRVEPSPENGLTVPSVIMIFQMRAIDKTRIIHQIGHLSSDDLKRVDNEIWRMLKPASL